MKKLIGAMVFILSLPSIATASTECTEGLDRIWAGDGGAIWFHLTSGGSFKLSPTDPNQKSILSLGLTAMTTGNSIVVRYAADNIVCASAFGREDVKGVYLYSRKL